MTAFGTIYYARKYIENEKIADPLVSRGQDGLYRIYVDSGFRVDATRTTCSNINSRFGKNLRFRIDKESRSYQIMAQYDRLTEVREKLSRYKGEGSNCIWREKSAIRYPENG